MTIPSEIQGHRRLLSSNYDCKESSLTRRVTVSFIRFWILYVSFECYRLCTPFRLSKNSSEYSTCCFCRINGHKASGSGQSPTFTSRFKKSQGNTVITELVLLAQNLLSANFVALSHWHTKLPRWSRATKLQYLPGKQIMLFSILSLSARVLSNR